MTLEGETMNQSQTAAPAVPGLGVGSIMARRDRPYPWKALHPVATITLLVAVVLICAFAVVQHQAEDMAFQAYSLKTSSVDISSLATHPERYSGLLVHTRGETGDVILTDAGKQVVLSLPRAPQGAGSDASAEILVLTGADVPPHSLVDVWGTFAGTQTLDGSSTQESMPVLRAEHVKSAQ